MRGDGCWLAGDEGGDGVGGGGPCRRLGAFGFGEFELGEEVPALEAAAQTFEIFGGVVVAVVQGAIGLLISYEEEFVDGGEEGRVVAGGEAVVEYIRGISRAAGLSVRLEWQGDDWVAVLPA